MNKLTDLDPMPFGTHSGKKMMNVPADYLLWLYADGCNHPALKAYIEDCMSALKQECPDAIVAKRE